VPRARDSTRNARFAPGSRQPSAIRALPPLPGVTAAGAGRPPPPRSPAAAPTATAPRHAAPTWARAGSASRSRCRDRGRPACREAAVSRQPSAVSSPPPSLDEGVRLRHRHPQRVTVLDPAQSRDALQRPRRRGQPRNTAVSRQPSAVRRELKTRRANAGSARVHSQWSRSYLKASRLSPRYWSFIGIRYRKEPSAVSCRPSARAHCFVPGRSGLDDGSLRPGAMLGTCSPRPRVLEKAGARWT
jgi:hypothetical protein